MNLHTVSTSSMRQLHREMISAEAVAQPWEWPLRTGEVRRIEPAPVMRWLDVSAGRVGDRLALPAGSAWVLEAWPSARVALHLAPPAGALLC